MRCDCYNPYKYQGKCEHIVDGDTFHFVLDQGFNDFTRKEIRLLDIDTAEYGGEEEETAKKHTKFVEKWMKRAEKDHDGEYPFFVVTEKDGTGFYCRYLASVYRRSDGESLKDALLAEFGEDVRYN